MVGGYEQKHCVDLTAIRLICTNRIANSADDVKCARVDHRKRPKCEGNIFAVKLSSTNTDRPLMQEGARGLANRRFGANDMVRASKLYRGGCATMAVRIEVKFDPNSHEPNGAFFVPCLRGWVAVARGREDMAYVQGVSLKVMLPSATVLNSRLLRRLQGNVPSKALAERTMTNHSTIDYDTVNDLEYTRAALRTLSAMAGALMAQGDSIELYALGYEVLLDTQEKRLEEIERVMRADLASRKLGTNESISETTEHTLGVDAVASSIRGKLAPNSIADADDLSTGLDGDLSEERQRAIEADLKLKAGTVQRVIDQLQAKRQDHSSEREAVA